MSQFDTLLDFGDTPTSETNGTRSSQNFDEFDPFSPSSTVEGKTSVDSGNLLVDFGLDSDLTKTQSQNGMNSDPFNGHQFDEPSPNTNPLYEMSANNTNPLYEFETSQSEFADEVLNAVQSNQKSSNQSYEAEEIDDEALFGQPADSPSNPLYEYSQQEEVDSVTQQQETDQSYVTQDGDQETTREETSYEYSENNDQLVDSYQEEEIPSNRNSSGNWEEEGVTTETYTSSSMEPEGEMNTETMVTRTSKSRSRSPEIVETVREVREIRSSSPEYYNQETVDAPETRQENIYDEPENKQDELKDTKQDGGHSVTTTTKKETVTEVKGGDQRGGVGSMKIKQETTTASTPASSTIHQNGVDTKVTQQTTKQEIRQTETTRTMAAQENNYQDFDDDEDDEGVYENVPAAPRTDVFRETDNKVEIELPQASTAKNMRERFLKLAEESAAGNRTADKELTPPPAIRGQIEAGVFESQPEPSRNDVYHYTEQSKEVITEKGKALNTVQRYKEIASREFKGPANKRDITPDRSGVVEYVSEPRAEHLTYEEKPLEAGIFESQPTVVENVSRYEDYVPDELPQQGTARNIASRFHEIERNATLPPAPSNRREVTPDRHGRGEYVSEPRAQHLTYEEKVEGGIYENQPAPVRTDIFRHEEYYQEEPLPEKGYAKNIVSRFKEIEKNAHVHQKTIQRLSPPKDSKAVVYENEPSASPIAYKETVKEEDILPERGQAKNLASRFKLIEQENLKARAGNRQVKEFTPPKDDRSVFESQPSKSHLIYEERQVEHGILESQPSHREDVCRESDPKNIEEELPERGVAKNLLSRWKQIESSSNRASPPTPGRVKEFTPPREEERIKELRSPKNLVSPTGHGNSVHPNDLPGQYQPINEPTVFESQPTAPREDLFREADTNWASGLPKPNKTKKVLAKFQAIQSKAQSSPVSPANRKEEAAPPTPVKENKTKKGGIFMPVQNEKCGACQKTVYAMEKVEMNKNAYHRACFKCSQCSTVLTPKTFAINAGTMFCTSHYKQLFARKGNYDEGFGRQQHKKKWKSESNLLDKELVDMEHEIEA